MNHVFLPDQLKLNAGRVAQLQTDFPVAGFPNTAVIIDKSQLIRTSTGIEFQIMMPVVNAPFRLYWAYNPTRVYDVYTPPIAADRTLFPNEATYQRALATVGMPSPYVEKRTMFRFTISRTF